MLTHSSLSCIVTLSELIEKANIKNVFSPEQLIITDCDVTHTRVREQHKGVLILISTTQHTRELAFVCEHAFFNVILLKYFAANSVMSWPAGLSTRLRLPWMGQS